MSPKLSRRQMLTAAASAVTVGAAVLPSLAASEQPQAYPVGKDPGKHEPQIGRAHV